MSETTNRKFDALYNATKEELLKGDKKMVEARLRLSFQRSYDSAFSLLLSAKEEIEQNEKDLKTYNMEKSVRMLEEIRDQEYTMKAIADEYLRMFGEEIQKHEY